MDGEDKIRIPWAVKLLLFLAALVFIVLCDMYGDGNGTSDTVKSAVEKESGITDSVGVADYFETAALNGKPIVLDEQSASEAYTRIVSLDRFVTEDSVRMPFKDGSVYRDITLTLQYEEEYTRSYSADEEYSIYVSYGAETVTDEDAAPGEGEVLISVNGTTLIMDTEQCQQAEAEISSGIDEIRKGTMPFTIPGEAIVSVLAEKCRIPWQALYCCAAFNTNLTDDEGVFDEYNNPQITEEIFADVCACFSDLSLEFAINYWLDPDYWESIVITEEDIGLLTAGDGTPCYVLYYDDNSAALSSGMSGERILWRRGIRPLCPLIKTEGWAVTDYYEPYSDVWSYYEMSADEVTNAVISRSVPSDSMLTYIDNNDYEWNSDMLLFTSWGEDLPGADKFLTEYALFEDLINNTDSFCISASEITWLNSSVKGDRVTIAAINYLGDIYSQNRRYTSGYKDCSSLAWTVYNDCGIDIADGNDSTAAGEAHACVDRQQVIATSWNEGLAQPGDLIFWETTNSKHVAYSRFRHIYHVGIYAGNGYIIDASSSIGRVVCRHVWGIDRIVLITRPE